MQRDFSSEGVQFDLLDAFKWPLETFSLLSL